MECLFYSILLVRVFTWATYLRLGVPSYIVRPRRAGAGRAALNRKGSEHWTVIKLREPNNCDILPTGLTPH